MDLEIPQQRASKFTTMTSGNFGLFFILALCVNGLALADQAPTPFPTPLPMKIDLKCHPEDKFADCPHGYCCVRDEFLPTYVYCKRFGRTDEHCATRDTLSDCPCAEGYGCKPNIVSAEYQSLYGKCTKDFGVVG